MVRKVLPQLVGCRRDCKFGQHTTRMIASVGRILVIAVRWLANRSFTANDNVCSQGVAGTVCQGHRACTDWTDEAAGGTIAVELWSVAHQVNWGFGEKTKIHGRSTNVGE